MTRQHERRRMPAPVSTDAGVKLGGAALVLAAVSFLGAAILATIVVGLVHDNRDSIRENDRQNDRLAHNQGLIAAQQDEIRKALHRLEDTVRRLERLENPTAADFRRLLRNLLDALNGPGSAAREARERVRAVIRSLAQTTEPGAVPHGTARSGGGNVRVGPRPGAPLPVPTQPGGEGLSGGKPPPSGPRRPSG